MRACLWLLILLILGCDKKVSNQTVVGFQVYKGFPEAKRDTVIKTIAAFYGVQTVVLPEIQMMDAAFVEVKSPRYRADSILRIQRRKIPDTVDYIIGLTHRDISTSKKGKDGKILEPASKYSDWGIMGLSYCPGNSCVVSTFRLKTNNQPKHLNRLKKVTVHEFGHSLGLPHCPNKKCVMTDAVESVATIDNALLELCTKCKAQLHMD